MAKRRKTRAQKQMADFRHNFTHSPSQIVIQPQVISDKELPKKTSTSSYPYLIKDLSKTTILTFTILAAQVVLFFLLTNHVIKVFGLIY